MPEALVEVAAAAPIPASEIRAFQRGDLKELRMLIGMGVMEQLPVANQQTYLHPMVVSAWVVLSCVMIQVLGWWPLYDQGFLGYLNPVPAFAAIAVPVLFAVDWYHRPSFEKSLRRTLSGEDILDIQSFYSSTRSPHSRFSVLIWNQRPIGFVGIDAATPDEELVNMEDENLLPSSDASASTSTSTSPPTLELKSLNSKRHRGKSTSTHALIRHFHVDRLYHSTNIQVDLVQEALSRLFSSTASPRMERVQVRVSSVEPRTESMWREVGFVEVQGDGKKQRSRVVIGESVRLLELSRAKWESLRTGATKQD